MYTFITNPNARSGLGGAIWSEIEKYLKENSVPYEIHFTKKRLNATELTRSITADGQEHTLVVLGGDGTINEVIDGIADYSKITLGYIPIGSSNDFARALKLTKEPMKALQSILHPSEYLAMNVGLLSFKNKERRFAVSTGIGFDAAICHEAIISRAKVFLNKLKLGKLTYVLIAMHQLFTTKTRSMTITLDDGEPITFPRVLFVVAMNTAYEGGGFKFCPKADPSDDVLDVMVVENMPKPKVLLMLPTAFSGKHVNVKGIHTYQCRKVFVDSEVALAVHTDGEPVFLQHKIQASLLPEKLRLILH